MMNLGEARAYKTDEEKSNESGFVSEPGAVATGSGSDLTRLVVSGLEIEN